jgi:protein import protein ZIM17
MKNLLGYLKPFTGRFCSKNLNLFKLRPGNSLASFNSSRLYSNGNTSISGEESELEAVKKALKNSKITAQGQEKRPCSLLIGFTCKVCKKRTHKTMSHQAYTKGIVLIECPGCQSRHLIADNLGWFKDTPNAAKRIEEMEEVGEIRRDLKLSENEAAELVELLK